MGALSGLSGLSGISICGGGGGAPPIVPDLFYYEGGTGILDGSGNPQTTAYGFVKTWQDQKSSGTKYDLSQSTSGKYAQLRIFSPPGVYALTNTSSYLNQATCPINQQAFSVFFLSDYSSLQASASTISGVLFEMVGGAGMLRFDNAVGSLGRLQWVDGGGTHDTGLRLQSGTNLIGVVLSASAVTIYSNDSSVTYSALSAGTTTGFNILNSAAAGGLWTGIISCVVGYNRALNLATEVPQMQSWAVGRGVVMPLTSKIKMIVAGASLATGNVAEDYAGFGWQVSRPNAEYYNIGFPNKTYVTAVSPGDSTHNNFYELAKLDVVYVYCGQNDIAAGTAAATVYANRNTFVGTLRAQGFIVLEGQIMPSAAIDAASADPARVAFNALLAGSSTRQYSNIVTGVVPGLTDDTQKPPFGPDGTHWLHVGHGLKAAFDQSSLTTLLALSSQVTTLQASYSFNGNAQDSTIYTRDLPLFGSPSYATGLGGQQCLVLASASSQYAYYTVTSATTWPGVFDWYPLTVAFWLKTTNSVDGAKVCGNFYLGDGWHAYLTSSGHLQVDIVRISAAGSVSSGASTAVVNDGVWHFIAINVDSGGVKVYISPNSNPANAVLDKSVAWTGTPGPLNSTAGFWKIGTNHGHSTFTDMSIQTANLWAESKSLAYLQTLQAISGIAVPEAPDALATGTYTTGSQPVTCRAPLSNGATVSYKFYLALHGGAYSLAGTSSTPSFTYTVTDGLTYDAKCTAVNSAGESAYSNVITFLAANLYPTIANSTLWIDFVNRAKSDTAGSVAANIGDLIWTVSLPSGGWGSTLGDGLVRQNTSGNRPTLRSDGAQCNGTSTYMSLPASVSVAGDTGWTLYVVDNDTGTTDGTFWFCSSVSFTGQYTNGNTWYWPNDGSNSASNITGNVTGLSIKRMRSDSTKVYVKNTGGAEASGSCADSAATFDRILADAAGRLTAAASRCLQYVLINRNITPGSADDLAIINALKNIVPGASGP